MEHGTLTGYTYHACRCEACRDAQASYHREYRLRQGYRTVTLYHSGGATTDLPAYMHTVRRKSAARSLVITESGREYLRAMKQEAVA